MRWAFLSRASAPFTTAVVGLLLAVAQFAVSSAQQPPQHLNPVIDKLQRGERVFGVAAGDLSMENARALARAPIDYVRIEMEHGPMNFEALRNFLLGMIDKEAVLKKGNGQPQVAPFARFAPYGREPTQWVLKQALDAGLMGVIVNTVDSREQALSAVRGMRYPQPQGSAHVEPAGLRGLGPFAATWFWGIPSAEYIRRADLWPLNPRGDLLAIMLVESSLGLKNIDEIVSTPGVGGIFVGTADLAMSMGVPANTAAVESAVQTILKSCLARNVPCGIVVDSADVQKRIAEGWRILDVGRADGGLSAQSELTMHAATAPQRP